MHYNRQEINLLSVYLEPGLGHRMPDIVYLETFLRLMPQTVAMKFAWTGIHQQLKKRCGFTSHMSSTDILLVFSRLKG